LRNQLITHLLEERRRRLTLKASELQLGRLDLLVDLT